MQALAEAQRKAGLLLDDGAPVKLTLAPVTDKEREKEGGKRNVVLGEEEEEDGLVGKRKVPLVKLDFSAAEGEKAKEALEKIRMSVPRDKETLFKAKVRWDGLSDVRFYFTVIFVFTTLLQLMIDRKLKRLMIKYLGELEEDDLVMFVVEHLKDHKGPQKLIEGLEPARNLRQNGLFIIQFLRIGAGRRSNRACNQCLAPDNI